jgi:hypothetical protein
MRVFIAHAYADAEDLADELRQTLSESGYEAFMPDSSYGTEATVMASISVAIRTADVVIALLTSPNPNVYFELGLAAGSNVPMLVASRHPADMAFDLAAAPYVELTGNPGIDAAAIVRRLREIVPVREDVAERPNLTLADVAQDPGALESISLVEFERLVAKAFEDVGYEIRTASSRLDAGFDLLIEGDPHTIVEVKRYRRRNLVGVGHVRQLFGTMTAAGAGRAILVSSGGFTRSAEAEAAQWPIELLTLDDLLGLRGPTHSPPDQGIDTSAP